MFLCQYLPQNYMMSQPRGPDLNAFLLAVVLLPLGSSHQDGGSSTSTNLIFYLKIHSKQTTCNIDMKFSLGSSSNLLILVDAAGFVSLPKSKALALSKLHCLSMVDKVNAQTLI
jgi:hypothetical protein